MIEVLVYSRANCHLCDVAKEQIIQIQEEVKNEVQFSLEIKLIDGSADLESEYGEHVRSSMERHMTFGELIPNDLRKNFVGINNSIGITLFGQESLAILREILIDSIARN